MLIVRSIALFLLAALLEIGGAWLVWQGVREHRGWIRIGAGVIALGLYGFIATGQPDVHFGRILAAYGGVFVAGSLAWGMAFDGFRPDRWDVIGALICIAGVACASRAADTDAITSHGAAEELKFRRSSRMPHSRRRRRPPTAGSRNGRDGRGCSDVMNGPTHDDT